MNKRVHVAGVLHTAFPHSGSLLLPDLQDELLAMLRTLATELHLVVDYTEVRRSPRRRPGLCFLSSFVCRSGAWHSVAASLRE